MYGTASISQAAPFQPPMLFLDYSGREGSNGSELAKSSSLALPIVLDD